MDGSGSAAIFPNTRTPEDVFTDFRARRAGILKALTTGISPSCSRGRFFFVLDFAVGFVAYGFVCLDVSVARRCGEVLQVVRPRSVLLLCFCFFFLVPLETIRAQCGGLFNPTAFLGVGLHYSIGLLLWRSVKFQCALLS
jgi:hypothetical protein